MSEIGGLQDLLALAYDDLGLTIMDAGWGQQAQATMIKIVVIPGKESSGPSPGLTQRGKLVGKSGMILEGFEVSLRLGIIIGHLRPRVAFGDPQVVEQLGHWLGFHRAASIRMQAQLALDNPLLGAALTN